MTPPLQDALRVWLWWSGQRERSTSGWEVGTGPLLPEFGQWMCGEPGQCMGGGPWPVDGQGSLAVHGRGTLASGWAGEPGSAWAGDPGSAWAGEPGQWMGGEPGSAWVGEFPWPKAKPLVLQTQGWSPTLIQQPEGTGITGYNRHNER